MNILIVNPILHTSEKGVIPRHKSNHDCMIYTMARGMVANGHKVTLAAAEEFRADNPDNEDFKVVYLPSRLPKIFRPDLIPWSAGLGKLIRSGHFDVVITSEIFSIASLIATRAAKVPVVVWQELGIHQRKMKKIPSKTWYNLIAATFMRRAIVVGRSKVARDFAKRYMPIVREDIVDHGCNSTLFFPGQESDDSFIIVSQLIERKQPLKMLDAFIEFLHRPGRDKFILHVVGRGALLDAMKATVKARGVERNVIFHGFLRQEEFATLGRRSKGMLINTLQDLNMVSVPEAIVNGTPILMNTVPYTAGYVSENGLGIAKDNWGADELETMADNYESMHKACVAAGHGLTEVSCAAKLVELAFAND